MPCAALHNVALRCTVVHMHWTTTQCGAARCYAMRIKWLHTHVYIVSVNTTHAHGKLLTCTHAAAMQLTRNDRTHAHAHARRHAPRTWHRVCFQQTRTTTTHSVTHTHHRLRAWPASAPKTRTRRCMLPYMSARCESSIVREYGPSPRPAHR